MKVPGLMISNELTGHGKIVSHVSESRHGAPSSVVGGADVGYPPVPYLPPVSICTTFCHAFILLERLGFGESECQLHLRLVEAHTRMVLTPFHISMKGQCVYPSGSQSNSVIGPTADTSAMLRRQLLGVVAPRTAHPTFTTTRMKST